MKKISLGLLFGLIAGIIDVIPMLIQHLSWDANLSAFTFWIITGFFIATTNLPLKGALKGVTISLLLLIPTALIVGWQEPKSLIPIIIMNLILGSGLGFILEKYKINS